MSKEEIMLIDEVGPYMRMDHISGLIDGAPIEIREKYERLNKIFEEKEDEVFYGTYGFHRTRTPKE